MAEPELFILYVQEVCVSLVSYYIVHTVAYTALRKKANSDPTFKDPGREGGPVESPLMS